MQIQLLIIIQQWNDALKDNTTGTDNTVLGVNAYWKVIPQANNNTKVAS